MGGELICKHGMRGENNRQLSKEVIMLIFGRCFQLSATYCTFSVSRKRLRCLSDSDEPLLSGSGDVNRECSEDVLSAWGKVMEEWKADPDGYFSSCLLFSSPHTSMPIMPLEVSGVIVNESPRKECSDQKIARK